MSGKLTVSRKNHGSNDLLRFPSFDLARDDFNRRNLFLSPLPDEAFDCNSEKTHIFQWLPSRTKFGKTINRPFYMSYIRGL